MRVRLDTSQSQLGSPSTFEWTPDAGTVDNLNARDGVFNLTFGASDGQLRTLKTVQVRVLDVNRAPQLRVANHALLVGQTFSLPVVKNPQG